MATQSKVNSLSQTVQAYIAKPRFRWPVVAVLTLIAVLVVGAMFVATLPTANNEPGNQRAQEVNAARYTALAEFYLAKEANSQRALTAETARYNGLAGFYLTENEPGNQRAIEADAARYSALAKYYGAQNDGLQRGIAASAARYTALAGYYATAGK